NSAEYIHASVEALKLAFADREKLGDTDFVQIPYEGLLSKAYAAERRKLIDPDHASLEIRPGNPEQFMKVAAAPGSRLKKGPGSSSLGVVVGVSDVWPGAGPLFLTHAQTHVGEADYSEGDRGYIAVVDNDHNRVSFEPSLHSGFGTGVVMADLGFIFNCRGD